MTIKNEKEFKEFALENYVNEHCLSLNEFENDIKTIFLIKRLFKKFLLGEGINGIVLINLFVALHNVFPDDYVFEEILIYKIEDYYYGNLKSVLIYMQVDYQTDIMKETVSNTELTKLLRKIKYKYNK